MHFATVLKLRFLILLETGNNEKIELEMLSLSLLLYSICFILWLVNINIIIGSGFITFIIRTIELFTIVQQIQLFPIDFSRLLLSWKNFTLMHRSSNKRGQNRGTQFIWKYVQISQTLSTGITVTTIIIVISKINEHTSASPILPSL